MQDIFHCIYIENVYLDARFNIIKMFVLRLSSDFKHIRNVLFRHCDLFSGPYNVFVKCVCFDENEFIV